MANSKHINENFTQETPNINQEETVIEYDGINWIKYKINCITHEKSIQENCTVIFPVDSNEWIWNYKMLHQNKILNIDNIEYKIIGFSWQCYDGVMKNKSTIHIKLKV